MIRPRVLPEHAARPAYGRGRRASPSLTRIALRGRIAEWWRLGLRLLGFLARLLGRKFRSGRLPAFYFWDEPAVEVDRLSTGLPHEGPLLLPPLGPHAPRERQLEGMRFPCRIGAEEEPL